MNDSLKTKILEVSKNLGMSHIGSNLSCLPVLEEIYQRKNPHDKVILDNGHAHLAHLAVKTKYESDSTGLIYTDVEDSLRKYGIHCDRKAGCDSSSGSLGHGIGVGIGYALANPEITVYIIVSDGSMQEGSNWEALRLIDSLKVRNIIIYANFNGFSAVAPVDFYTLKNRMRTFCGKQIEFRQTTNPEGFEGVQGHYKKI